MATATTDFLARVRADSSQAVAEFSKLGNQIEKSMDRASNSTEKLDNALVKMARGAVGGVAFREIAQFSMSMVKSTAQLEDTIAAAGVTFGEYSDQIEEFAKSAARNFGISKVAALDAANQFAALGKSAGLTGEELAGFSTEMVSLAGDMASFRGTSVEDAIMAIGSGLRGESEPLRRFGVLLDDATLRARAMAMGIYEGTGTLSAQQKVLAAQAEILAQTSDAQGDFARTSDSTANSLKTAAAEMENAKAAAGEALAPALTAVTQSLTPVLQGFAELPSELQTVTVNATLAAGAFSSASEAIKGLGIASKTANVLVGGVVGVLAGAATVYALYSQSKAEAVAQTQALADALRDEGEGQVGAIERLAQSDEDVRAFIRSLNQMGLSVEDVNRFINGQSNELSGLSDAYQDTNDRGLRNFFLTARNVGKVEELATQYGLTANELMEFMRMLERLNTENDTYVNTQNAVNRALGDGATENRKYARFLGQVDVATSNVVKITDEMREAIDRDKAAIERVNDAYRDQLDLIEELYGDQRDAIQRQLDYADAMVDYSDAVKDSEASTRDQMDAAIELSEQFATLNGATLDSEEGVNRQVEALDNMLATLKPGSPLYEALLEYRNQLDAIPETVNTLVSLGLPQGQLLGAGIASTGGMNPTMLKTATGDLMAPGSVFGAGPVNLVVNVYEPVADGVQIANALASYIRRNGTRFLQGVS